MQSLSSKLLEKAVEQFASLPGIGRKTALRYVLHMLRQSPEEVKQFTDSITALKEAIKECQHCHNISDSDICEICSDPKRDAQTICVVENIKDIMSLEATGQYHGLYHVLGGIISPMDGIGPEDIRIRELLARLKDHTVKEVILATNPDIEGEATASYIARLLKPMGVLVTRIAHGVPVGSDLEYADEITLSKAMEGRREM